MKIVIAPDSFKESLSAEEVANAIAQGFSQIFSDVEFDLVPVADGGEGTTDALVAATQGQMHIERVVDPLGRPIDAHWGMLGNSDGDLSVAVIETASASGLERLTTQERDPLHATSRGTGQLILKALDQGAKRIILGLGGSATNDGGMGLLSALGVGFFDAAGNPLPEGGAALEHLSRIDCSTLDPRVKGTEFLVACDVDNPLLGKRGASAIFGPQKGATPAMVEQLDRALARFADISESVLGKSERELAGAGAAGGLGFGLVQFLNARLAPGINLVLDAVNFDRRVSGADLVVTGEGRIDGQSLGGKTPVGVARWAKQHQVPVIAFCGSIGESAEKVHDLGIDALFSVVPGVSTLEQALEEAGPNLQRCAEQVARLLKIGSVALSSI